MFILYQKEKYVHYQITGKRKRDDLTKCSTIDANKLKKAAADSGNEALLMEIQNQDCVAIEVSYPWTCFRDFTRCMSR